jgi:hypothetical protein
MRIVLSLDLFCIPGAKALGIQNKSRDSTILMFPQDTGLFIIVLLYYYYYYYYYYYLIIFL